MGYDHDHFCLLTMAAESMDVRSTSRSTSTPVTEISSDSSQSSYSDVDNYESSTTPSTSAVPSLLDKL